MTRTTDVSAAIVLARHCNELNCSKCRAQFRWMRRKAWRSRKSPTRRDRGRKR
jgi:hypothetical protein